MVKKRELTVEKWHDLMEWDRAEAKRLGPLKFYRTHQKMGHRMENVLFEFQMSDAWANHGMQVYEFDPDFTESILNEKWAELLPDCLKYRPHDCFYMKLPCGKLNEGTVVWVNPVERVETYEEKYFPGVNDGKGVYIGGVEEYGTRAVVNTGDGIYVLSQFAISKTLELMLDDTEVEFYPAELVANGVAYICSANADITTSYTPRKEARRNNAKRRSQATWHEVGYRIGSELRAYKRYAGERKPHQGGTVRPHMRRAHWHHYWTGPRDGERRLVLKWIAPIMVGTNIESATGHKVRSN